MTCGHTIGPALLLVILLVSRAGETAEVRPTDPAPQRSQKSSRAQDTPSQQSSGAQMLFASSERACQLAVRPTDPAPQRSQKSSRAQDTARPLAVRLSGAESAPAKAYARYYEALYAGDLPTVKKLVTRESWKSFEGEDPQTIAEFAELVKPAQAKIVESKIEGGTAKLRIEGVKDGQSLTGAVTMVLDGSEWKVKADEWKSPEEP